MNSKPLGTIAKIIAGQSPSSSTYNSAGVGLPFFQGKADFQEMYPTVRMWCNSLKRKEAETGDILISVRAPVGAVNICNQKSIIGRGLAAIRPFAALEKKFLYYFLKTSEKQIDALGTGSTFKAITQATLKGIQIPLPPFDDQKRIAHLLGKVEGLITRRKQHLQQLDELLKSVFLEMFGDPVRNEKGWKTVPFHRIGHFVSGGTPSKSRSDFWVGEFPWVSPKDMKTTKISDAIDHISEAVFEETSLKRITPGHLLIVVRGMILAHSFPVAINAVEVSINQDMKAIKPTKGINAIYLQNCITSLKRQILKLISTAGHGTRKFDAIAMQKLFIPKPPEPLQNQFAAIVEKIENLKSRYQKSLADLECLYGALSQKAFKGKLDLSRVPLPVEADATTAKEEKTDVEEKQPMEPSFELPAPADFEILQSAEGRKTLISQWLTSWLNQLGNEAFTVQTFIEAAGQRLFELSEIEESKEKEYDFKEWITETVDFKLADYDHLKTLVFEALDQGRLTHTYDDAKNRVQTKAAKE